MEPQYEYESGREDEFEGARPAKRKAPAFTADPSFEFDYKDPTILKHFLTDRGKIIPRRVSGLSAKQQRQLTQAIKLARKIALVPYTS